MSRTALQVRHRTRFAARALATAIALVGVAAGADETRDTVYQWTDAKGVYRYTPDLERVPGSARHTVVTIQAGEAPPSNEPIYFQPDPRAKEVAVPNPPVAASAGPSAGSTASAGPAPAPSDPSAASEGPGAAPAEGKAERIRALEAQIAAYEEALKGMVSEPGTEADAEIPPELREIAARLPELQAELAALKRDPRAAAP